MEENTEGNSEKAEAVADGPSKLDRIVKLLPLGATLLIVFGVLRVTTYYNHFGIDILSYLSLTDVVALFLNDYVSVVVVVILGAVHLILSESVINKAEKLLPEVNFDAVLMQHSRFVFEIVS